MESIRLRCTSTGLGDNICGLYTAAGAIKAGKKAIYNTRFSDVLDDIVGVQVEPYHLFISPPIAKNVYSDYSGELLYAKDRKEHYSFTVGVNHVSIPNTSKKYVYGNYNTIIIFPFTEYKQRDVPLKKYIELEKRLLASGIEVIIAGTSSHKNDFTVFKSKTLIDEPLKKIKEALFNVSCVVCGDTGIAHLCGLYGIPCISIAAHFSRDHLFSKTSVKVLNAGLGCENCKWQPKNGYKKTCELQCASLALISTDKLEREVKEMVMVDARRGVAKYHRQVVENPKVDVSFVAAIAEADGLGKLGLRYFTEAIKAEYSTNINLIHFNKSDLDYHTLQILNKHRNNEVGRNIINIQLDDPFPNTFSKRYRYQMFEATELPWWWVQQFNSEKLDGIFVPDDFVKEIFEKYFDFPIITIPHGIDSDNIPLNDFSRHKIFSFGITSQMEERKNHLLVVEAFKLAFGNNPSVKLRVHGRWGHLSKKIAIACSTQKNIEFVEQVFSTHQFNNWWASLDCYVLASAGEGFSFTPREAIIRGIPTIVSSWGAHNTLVKSGGFEYIDPIGFEAAYKHIYGGLKIGEHAIYSAEHLAEKMKEVYANHSQAREKAMIGCNYVRTCERWEIFTKKMMNYVIENE